MANIHDDVLDAALSYISTNAENLYICNAIPTTFTEAATTFKLGTKASPGFTGPANGDVSGRKITVNAITDGAITVTDDATHWGITDDSATKLLVAGALDALEAVTSGNTFTLDAFDIELPDPA